MSFKIDNETRLNFDKMLKESGADDNTKKIRKLKHSDKIREQITDMVEIQTKYPRLGKKGINKMLESKCNWLFTHYTNLFNKLKKKQLNLQILDTFLSTLKELEEGDVDQHEASVKIGQVLKEMYIDSALKTEKQYEAKNKKQKKKYKKPEKKITWEEYKRMLQKT
tara:strand:- start:923 stop:1420 length:498 start_codon:yes stop_codon:yes gene_type:complete